MSTDTRPPSPIAIVAPQAEELRPLLKRLTSRSALKVPRPARAWSGRLAGQPIIAAEVGVGPTLAAAGLAAVLTAGPVRGVVVIGVAGGLDPGLTVGTVIACHRVLDAGGAIPPPDQERLGRLLEHAGIPSGVAVQSPRIVGTVDAKRHARGTIDQPNLVIDLESATLGRMAAERGLPYLVVRAVSDGADDALPEIILTAQRQDGSIDHARIVRHALTHPGDAIRLSRLGRRVRRCADALADAAEAAVEIWG